jgi:hypothetical protein
MIDKERETCIVQKKKGDKDKKSGSKEPLF